MNYDRVQKGESKHQPRTLFYRFLLLLLLISFSYAHPLKKLPFGMITALRLDDFVWVVVFTLWLFRYRPLTSIHRSTLTAPILLYISANAISLVASFFIADEMIITRSLTYGTFFFVKLLQYFSIFFMTTSIPWHDRDIALVVKTVFFMGVFVSAMGILQHLGIVTLVYDPTIPQKGTHVQSTLSYNYAQLGAFQVVTSTFALALAHQSSNIRGKCFYGFFLAVFLYVLVLSGSRSGCIGMAVALVTFFLYSDQKLSFLCIMILGLLILLALGTPDYIIQRYAEALKSGATAKGRVMSWLNLPEYINSSAINVLFGVGFMRFKFDALEFFHSDAGHNNFLNAYVEAGTLGLSSFLYLLVSIYWKARVRVRTMAAGSIRYFRVAFLASFLGLVTTCMSMETFSVVLAFTSFLGFFMFLTGVFIGYPQD